MVKSSQTKVHMRTSTWVAVGASAALALAAGFAGYLATNPNGPLCKTYPKFCGSFEGYERSESITRADYVKKQDSSLPKTDPNGEVVIPVLPSEDPGGEKPLDPSNKNNLPVAELPGDVPVTAPDGSLYANADLTVAVLGYSGEKMPIFGYANEGTENISADIDIVFSVESLLKGTTDFLYMGTASDMAGYRAGESSKVASEDIGFEAGEYKVCIDATELISELSEENNCVTLLVE